MSESIVVQRVANDEERARAYAIRWEVFVEEQGVPEDMELDEHDAHAVHVLAIAGGEAIGTGRLVMYAPGEGKIGRMAVLKMGRGQGAGTAIMAALTEAAKEQAMKVLILDSEVEARPFYARLGYVPEGEIFMDAGMPHQRMRLLI
jgi:predicted GNAT family N-acyltransferase